MEQSKIYKMVLVATRHYRLYALKCYSGFGDVVVIVGTINSCYMIIEHFLKDKDKHFTCIISFNPLNSLLR